MARELMSAADVTRTVARIAHQIIEKTALDTRAAGDESHPRVVIFGIPTRGAVLAARLAADIAECAGGAGPVGHPDNTPSRDDRRHTPHRPLERTTVPPQGVDGALVILVDDVLFSGRTVRAALDSLRDIGRPAAVQLAVLVDRGHRQLPIRADYVGKNIPTSRQEDVQVRLQEKDGEDAVVISELPDPETKEGAS